MDNVTETLKALRIAMLTPSTDTIAINLDETRPFDELDHAFGQYHMLRD